jgi:hypothetical protein
MGSHTGLCVLSEAAMGKGAVARLKTEVSGRLPQFSKDARTLHENFKASLKRP